MSRPAKLEHYHELIATCGNKWCGIVYRLGNTTETAAYIAEGLGDIIADGCFSQKEKRDLVGSCYGQYVIACCLKPSVHGKVFLGWIWERIAYCEAKEVAWQDAAPERQEIIRQARAKEQALDMRTPATRTPVRKRNACDSLTLCMEL